MSRILRRFKCAHASVAILLAVCALSPAAAIAQQADLDGLHAQLRDPDTKDWKSVEEQIWTEWAKSGSPAFDLLLERGREALEAGDTRAAIEHLTALTDHAPEFAEGWNARATAYYEADMLGPSISDIEQALALNPLHFGAMAGLAMILDQLEYKRDALSAYRAAAAIHPHRPDITKAIERLERALGDEAL